jgi:uncharacterized protein (DUF4415 family)
MSERKRTKAEEISFSRMVSEMEEQMTEIDRLKLKQRLIPPGWHLVENLTPVRPVKTKLNLALDADMVKWFRALGRGYQPRMNAVLRGYMHAVIAREIERAGDRDWKGELI